MPTPETCPNCGAGVPRGARACPECGSCEETGWSSEAGQGGLDLPDEEFNYAEFVEKEFGGEEAKPRAISWFWWVIGLLVLLSILVFLMR
jgi:hypothetical protein